jgi:hypothetical protein
MRAWIRNGEAYALASVAVGCIVVVVSSVFLWQWKHKKTIENLYEYLMVQTLCRASTSTIIQRTI